MSLISFKVYSEMARKGQAKISRGVEGEDVGDMSRIPLNYDSDDLSFLRQFDEKDWKRAQVLRWDKFHDILVKLHKMRLEIMKSMDLEKKIFDFLKTGTSVGLEKEYADKLRKEYGSIPLRNYDDSELEQKAHDESFEIVKNKTENLKELGLDPTEVDFDVSHGKTKADSKKRVIKAHPYFHRMYHKLERTRGEPHIPGSDNEGVGKYGYDLGYATSATKDGEKIKKTRGLNWVGEPAHRESIENFLKHASHGHFGKSGKENWAEWIPTKIKDPTYDWLLSDLQKEYVAKIEGMTPEKRKEAESAAEEFLNSEVKAGKIFAPMVKGIPKEERMFKIDEKGKIIKPFVYLPAETIVDKNGTERKVPILSPSHYLIKARKGDSEYDELLEKEIKRWHDGARPNLSVWKRMEAPDETSLSLKSKNDTKTVGINPNHNQKSATFVDPKSIAGQEILRTHLKLVDNFGTHQTGSLSGVVPEFIRGITSCLRKSTCGGAPFILRKAVLQELGAVHNLAYMAALKDLGNKQFETEKGRIGWANTYISSFLQNPRKNGLDNISYGTRRTPGARTGETGQTDAGGDIQHSDSDRLRHLNAADQSIRRPGDKKFDVSLGKRAELIKNFAKQIVDDAEQIKKDQQSPILRANIESKPGDEETARWSAEKLTALFSLASKKDDFYKNLEDMLSTVEGKAQAKERIKSWIDSDTDPSDAIAQIREMDIFKDATPSASPSNIESKPKPLPRPQIGRVAGGGLAARAAALRQPKPQDDPQDDEQKVDWVNGFSIYEKVQYYKNKLKG